MPRQQRHHGPTQSCLSALTPAPAQGVVHAGDAGHPSGQAQHQAHAAAAVAGLHQTCGVPNHLPEEGLEDQAAHNLHRKAEVQFEGDLTGVCQTRDNKTEHRTYLL